MVLDGFSAQLGLGRVALAVAIAGILAALYISS
jgi:hypothetical protein